MTYEEWLAAGNTGTIWDYNDLATQGKISTGTSGTGGTPTSSVAPLNLGNTGVGEIGSSSAYQRPAGIQEYNGYQAPNYNSVTPNSKHWLNTMNAFSPNARTDMERMLGFSAPAGSGGGGVVQYPDTGGVRLTESPWIRRPPTLPTTGDTGLLGSPTQPTTGDTGLLGGQQPATQPTNPFPFQRENSYMDAFWNTSGSAYAPPTQQTQQQTTQNAYTAPSGWTNGTVGINPATGALSFL